MDTSRFKRREIQTRRQTAERLYGVSDIVPRVVPTRPQIQNAEIPLEPVSGTTPNHVASQSLEGNQYQTPLVTQTHPVPVRSLPVQAAAINLPEPPHVSPEIEDASVQFQRLLDVNMELPGPPSPIRANKTIVHTGRLVTGRRLVFRGVALMLVIIIGVGGLLFSQGYMKIHKAFKGGAATAAALTVNVNPQLLKGEGDGRVNVLLLGRGGGTHDGPDLTDTMLLASIDPINHTATLLSIPRDLWVDIPNQGAMKINAAWETGEFNYLGKDQTGSTNTNAIEAGFNLADQTVESVLGVPIDYNVLLDFQAFRQAVDTVNE